MVRIYDAAFATTTGTEHYHLAKFWWESNGNTGEWTRQEAHDFVLANPKGHVYVSEGGAKVTVWAYHNPTTGTEWIQTQADGTAKNNLTELAERHRLGLPNN